MDKTVKVRSRSLLRAVWVISLALSCFTARAQSGQRTIYGIVTDTAGEPLVGATVQIVRLDKNAATQGVVVDVNGPFSLNFD